MTYNYTQIRILMSNVIHFLTIYYYILIGCLLGCVYHTSCVAACMNIRSPYISSPDETVRQKVNASKKRLLDSLLRYSTTSSNSNNNTAGTGFYHMSDYLIISQAIYEFSVLTNREQQRKYARDNGLSYERMSDIIKEQKDLLQNLQLIGFITSISQGLNLQSIDNRNSHKLKVILSACVTGLYPNIARILRPPQRYIETLGGNIEKDLESNEFKFYIPKYETSDTNNNSSGSNSNSNLASMTTSNNNNTKSDSLKYDEIDLTNLQRVFVHPSSINFNNSKFKHCSYIAYGEKQLTSSNVKNMENAKIFLRETNEVTIYSLLLFGGEMEINYKESMICIDGWIYFSAPGRIAALIYRLRQEFDSILDQKLNDLNYDITTSKLLNVAVLLLESDGLV